MRTHRRDFIKKGLLFLPVVDIFVPKIIRAQAFTPRDLAAQAKAVPVVSSGPAVAFDSKFEKGSASSASPFSFVSNAGTVTGTVGSNSNRLLIAYVSFRSAVPTAVAITWNSVSMTQIVVGTNVATSSSCDSYLFGLIAPATGNQTLSVSWATVGATQVVLGAVSLYNVNQTTAWQNSSAADFGTGPPATSTVTSANGNMVVAGHTNDNASSTAISQGTGDWVEALFNSNFAMGHAASVGSTAVVAWTFVGSSVVWANLKVDAIKA